MTVRIQEAANAGASKIRPGDYRQTLAHYPSGVCVITARDDSGVQAGMTVSSFASVSLDPPLVAFFPDRNSSSWPKIDRAGRFCVNILGAHQEWICRQFASKAADKFHDVDHRLSDNGTPIIDGAVAWIECHIHSVVEAGDHYIVLGEVIALQVDRAQPPLVFFQSGYGQFQAAAVAA